MGEYQGGQLFFTTAWVPRSQQQIGKPEPPAKRKTRATKPKPKPRKKRKRTR